MAAALGMVGGDVAGSLISGIFGNKAAGTQASAAKYAAQLEAQQAQNALDFQKQQFSTTQSNEAPFIKAGQGAVTTLSSLLKNGGFPAWNQTFSAPTAEQAEQNPGYKFALDQGQQALENSAAARGGLLSGATGEAEQEFGQNLASTNYQQVYNNALQQYQQQYNIYQNNQSNLFNRYATIAGLGQTSTGQLGQLGQEAATNTGNIQLTSGAQQGADLMNAAYQSGSGYINLGQQIGGAAQLSLAQLLKQNQNSAGGYDFNNPIGSNASWDPNSPGYVDTANSVYA